MEAKTDKWARIIFEWLMEAKYPVSCQALSYVSELKSSQVKHTLKVMRKMGQVDYVIGSDNPAYCRSTVRLWYVKKRSSKD